MTGQAGSSDADQQTADWVRDLASVLDGPDAAATAAGFAARVPASYREGTPPGEAALDMAELGALCKELGLKFSL